MNVMKSALFILSLFVLSACHHENPLKTHSKHDTLTFFMNASANAERRLHIPTQKDSYGYAYLECMDGKKSSDLQCAELYQGMIAFAKEGHYSGFSKLKMQDLTDHAFFTTLADDYAEFAATNEPKFVNEVH